MDNKELIKKIGEMERNPKIEEVEGPDKELLKKILGEEEIKTPEYLIERRTGYNYALLDIIKMIEGNPKCRGCGRGLIPVKDSIAKCYTGYLWRCICAPGIFLSIG